MPWAITELEFLMLPGNIGLEFEIDYPVLTRRYGQGYKRSIIVGNPEGTANFTLNLNLHRDWIPQALFGNTGSGYNFGDLRPVNWLGVMYNPVTERAIQSSLYYIWGFHKRHMAAGNKPFIFRHIIPDYTTWELFPGAGTVDGYFQRGTGENQDIYSLQRRSYICSFLDTKIRFTSIGRMRYSASLSFQQYRGLGQE